MKKSSFLINGIIMFVVIIPLMFYLWFAIGMTSTNSAKVIKLDWVLQYKSIIKKEFLNINDVNIYYEQGRICFDFITPNEPSLEECKHITKMTKDFIEKETASKPLTKDSFEQLDIRLNFDINDMSYVFECPYFTISQQQTRNINYKVWYLRINDEIQEKLEF